MLKLGNKIAGYLFPGAFIALFGDLGAGKTVLTKGMGEKLGIDNITSPTFTVVNHHEGGKIVLDHIDAYRLEDDDELYAIGFTDYLSSGSVIVMEWCENVPDALPEERLEIHITGSGQEKRTLEMISYGEKYDEILDKISNGDLT